MVNDKQAQDILYENSTRESEKQKERNALLNKIGDRLSPQKILYSKVDELKQINGAIGSFIQNYRDMRKANTKNADKYFHAKANCQASQYGLKGAQIAKNLSDFRENLDITKNKYKKKKDGTKMTHPEIMEDYQQDQNANLYGRTQGLKNKNFDCKILVDKYRPTGLSLEY